MADTTAGAIVASPSNPSNGFSISLPGLTVGGQNLGGSVNFDLNLGTSLSSLVNQSMAWVDKSNTSNQGFLSGVIDKSQTSLYGYINQAIPAFANIAAMTQANVNSTLGVATQIAQSNAQIAQASKPSGGGFCFITTAVCEAEGLPDDCDELRILREFRDTHMMLTRERAEAVRAYYAIAPEVTRRLRAMSELKREYVLAMCRSYIDSAIAYIRDGEFCNACRVYCAMVEYMLGEVA